MTDEDLSRLWILFLITVILSLVPILFLCLVPRRKEVFKVQQVNEFVEKYPSHTANERAESQQRAEFIKDIMQLDPITAKRMGVYEQYKEELGDSFEIYNKAMGVAAVETGLTAND